MAGFILLIAGFLKIGTLISHIPEAVIDGFTVGIAVIIATSQLQDLLGLEAASVPAAFIEKLPALWALRASFTPSALAIGLSSEELRVGQGCVITCSCGWWLHLQTKNKHTYIHHKVVRHQ